MEVKKVALTFRLAYDAPEELSELFSEYTKMLIAGDETVQEYLSLQNYGEELNHLEKKYGLPHGRIYVVYDEGKAAGCVGLRKINETDCELKRLFVRPEFRGKRIGRQLTEQVIRDAKEIGYSAMFLDTLPFLNAAIAMYRTLGFYEIESYNDSPMSTSIFMKLDLI